MKYGQNVVIDSSLITNGPDGDAKLTETSGNVIATCTGGTVKGAINNEGGATETVSANISELTWTGCNQTTDTVTNGSLEFHWIEGTHNATVTGKGSQVTVQIFGVSCIYSIGSVTHLGTLTGGAAPVLTINTPVTRTSGGILCPLTARWDAEYIVTEPHALFVTAS